MSTTKRMEELSGLCSGYRWFFVLTRHAAALGEGIRALRPAGRAVAVGMSPAEEVSVPMSFLQKREITLTGTFRYANTYEDAIALVAAGRIDLQSLITGYYPLHEAEKALQATRS